MFPLTVYAVFADGTREEIYDDHPHALHRFWRMAKKAGRQLLYFDFVEVLLFGSFLKARRTPRGRAMEIGLVDILEYGMDSGNPYAAGLASVITRILGSR